MVDAQPNNATALLTLAGIALDEGDTESAQQPLRRALVPMADAASANQLRTAAGIASSLGNSDEARALNQRATENENARSAELIKTIQDEPKLPLHRNYYSICSRLFNQIRVTKPLIPPFQSSLQPLPSSQTILVFSPRSREEFGTRNFGPDKRQ